MEEKPITVSQLSMYIKQIFDAEEMLYNIKVLGEISGLSIVRGVAYFTLKDENATLSCVCFDTSNFLYSNGESVIVTGTPRYYVKGGKLNFNVVKIAKYGMGELYQKFLELKNKLEKKGYFDKGIKKTLPSNIKRIGVVTSKEGAVIQDIINVGTRRNPFIDIVLYPVKVQGVNAQNEIAKGISFFDNYNVDVIIVARGGGSLEDLQPFNTEIVADAVYNCQKFIVSAVGHETDFTICDFCSDLRAPTPSAGAELVFSNIKDYILNFKQCIAKLKQSIKGVYIDKQQNFIDVCKDFYKNYKNINIRYQNRFNNTLIKFMHAIKTFAEAKQHKFEMLSSMLKKLNPKEVLKLGYASVKKGNEKILSIKNIKPNDNLQLTFIDGEAIVEVLKIKGEKSGI